MFPVQIENYVVSLSVSLPECDPVIIRVLMQNTILLALVVVPQFWEGGGDLLTLPFYDYMLSDGCTQR